MIYLAYDAVIQRTLARYNNQVIVCQNSDRAREILDGLKEVWELTQCGAYQVQYSDQAWKDLLSIKETGAIQ